jgi:uncharacterized metal-binding protein
LGLDHYPKPGEKLEKPILIVSTKLEEHDRYLTWADAKKTSGLTVEEVAEIKKLKNRLPVKAVIFNHARPIEVMFYTNYIAYERLPPKEEIGVKESEKIFIGEYETMCNPILQAAIVNDATGIHLTVDKVKPEFEIV